MRYQTSFGSQLTKSGKIFLMVYGIIYAIQLITEHWLNIPVTSYLALNPGNFKIHQVVTHLIIHNPSSPIGFLINALVFYFFSSQIESRAGTGGFFTLFYFSALIAALSGFLFALIAPDAMFKSPFFGIGPSLIAIVFLFGLLNPNASILLFFVLPVRAIYLSYGTLIITILTLLAKANAHGAYHLGGIAGAYLFLKFPFNIFRFNNLYYRYQNYKHDKKKRKFDVIEGGKDDNDKGPTIH